MGKDHSKTSFEIGQFTCPGNWSEKLYDAFDINDLPHNVLVDWKGKVVQNKCPRASGRVDELIDGLLIQMRKERD